MDDDAVIATIAQGLERWQARLGRQFGPLSRSQRRMLAAVATAGIGADVRVGDLAARAQLSTAGATRMVDTLEALGYVRRSRKPEGDQRQVYVALTAQGAAALSAADRAFLEEVRATLGVLTPAERATLARLLELLGADRSAGVGS